MWCDNTSAGTCWLAANTAGARLGVDFESFGADWFGASFTSA